MLKITILNDNAPGRHMLAEHGLSYLIETATERILLDAGATDVFLKNAKLLGLRLDNLNAVVLSHGHWDHGNGLKYLEKQTLVAHPAIFSKRYHQKRNQDYVGLSMDHAQMEKKFVMRLSAEPVLIGKDVLFLGEIPRLNVFESKSTAFIDAEGHADYVPDDSGVVIRTDEGLVVISGCAHAGICNTVSYASKLMNEERILAVMGGFHLKENDHLTMQTIAFLEEIGVKHVYPSHCTDLPALAQFYNSFGMNRIKTGDVISF